MSAIVNIEFANGDEDTIEVKGSGLKNYIKKYDSFVFHSTDGICIYSREFIKKIKITR